MGTTASAVSRALTTAGFRKSQKRRDRGWGLRTEGFETETDTAWTSEGRRPTGVIRVKWQPASVTSEATATGNGQIARAGEVLAAKGYTVERRTYSTGADFLHVTKED